MDRLSVLELFTRVMDRRSFSAAAADLGISRSAATTAIKQLEARLGTRLLQRSTRHVAPTEDGQTYYARCVAVLADLEDADRAYTGGAVSGLLRVDLNGHMARQMVLPLLPEFMSNHPALQIFLGEGDRLVDLLREGVDCVIRAGEPSDSNMIVRRLGVAREVTCASPAYLSAHGTPTSPGDLDGHAMIGFVSSRTGKVMPLEFTQSGKATTFELPARILVNNADTSVTAAKIGLGILQAPHNRLIEDLNAGALVEVLSDFAPSPMPISILYPSNRDLSPRVRVFIDWIVEVLGPQMQPL